MKLEIEIKNWNKKLPRKLVLLGYGSIAVFFGSILFIQFIPDELGFVLFALGFIGMLAALALSIRIRIRKKKN